MARTLQVEGAMILTRLTALADCGTALTPARARPRPAR